MKELSLLFLRLGLTAFGGPAAHIAMMEEEVVRRRGWLSHEQFLDLVGATNLIPGPNSTELAIHIGRLRAGAAGLVVAGTCFILPATLLVSSIAWAYVGFGTLAHAEGILYGVKPVIIAVVLQALWQLARTAVRSRTYAAVGLIAAVLGFLRVHELAILFGTGIVVMAGRHIRNRRGASSSPGTAACLGLPIVSLIPTTTAAVAPATVAGLWPLFLCFLKTGSILFGSGYVLLAYLRADLVERWGCLTESQLLDAIAVGQMTPGPVLTTATFIGYVLAGPMGAAVATVGIFLPSFLFVAASGPLIPHLRQSVTAAGFLDGVNLASLALMSVVIWHLGRAAVVDVFSAVLSVAAAVLVFRFRVNSSWLVPGGGLIGLLHALLASK